MSEDEKQKSADQASSSTPPEDAERGSETSEAETAANAPDPAEEADFVSPDAIAKRVAALGEEDESERQARLEEEKLAARRAKNKGAGKRGLEVAASKKLAKLGDKPSKRPVAARAVPNDPLLQKTNELGKWARANRGTVGAIVGAVFVVVGGFFLHEYLGQRKESQASEVLAEAVADLHGRIGEPTPEEAEAFRDPSPSFKTAAERQDATLAKFREVQTRYAGTGAAFLARLSEGSLLLDKRQPDPAAAAFSDVRASPLAAADPEVRGRALEGLGFAYELKAQGQGGAPPEPAKLDEALKVFRELENTDVKGFKELGMYHQARVYEAKGDKDKAKELLKSLRERVNKPGEGHPFPYLETVIDDRLRALDPTALPPKSPMSLGAGTGGNKKMSEAQMRKMMEQIQKQMRDQQEKGGGQGHAPPGQPK